MYIVHCGKMKVRQGAAHSQIRVLLIVSPKDLTNDIPTKDLSISQSEAD